MDIPIIGELYQKLDDLIDRGWQGGWYWVFFGIIAVAIMYFTWKFITGLF